MSDITIDKVSLVVESKKFSYNTTCSICLGELTEVCSNCLEKEILFSDTTIIICPHITSKCNHTFHSHCIYKWLQHHNTCPCDNKIWNFN